MTDLSSSLILLLVALVLLWLAVTDRLGRVIDAFNVIRGTATPTTSARASTASVPTTQTMLELPSLPSLGRINHVGA